jgi:tetratricopeptide (TPR) repeat protein
VAAVSTERLPRDAGYFRRVAEWGIAAAEALEHAHSLGIVHRDIKPGNLMVDGQGKLWVTDFGLARTATDAGLTMTGDILSTLRYMSPEQALAKHGLVDHRTDVYALGATLYELLTLRPAVDGKDREEILQTIAFEEPPAPRSLNQAIPVDLETVVLKAMSKEPGGRYATAKELADDLRRFADDEPIRGRRPSLAQRLRRWGRRRRGVVTAAAVAALVVLGVVGWALADYGVRWAATHQVVERALGEANDWQEKRKYPEALAAARRAEELAAGGAASNSLRQQAQRRRADLDLVLRLDEVRLLRVAIRDDPRNWELADQALSEAFHAAGIVVDGVSAEEAAAQIRGTTVAVELAAALDHWAIDRRALRGQGDAGWRHLLEVARRADPDDFRCRLREALSGGKRQAVEEIAGAQEVSDLPVESLLALAEALEEAGARQRAIDLLRDAQRRHPANFWVAFRLGAMLLFAKPVQVEEAIRFCTAAVALRPQSPGAHVNLGVALEKRGRLDEALAHYRETIQFGPEIVEGHINLGNILQA